VLSSGQHEEGFIGFAILVTLVIAACSGGLVQILPKPGADEALTFPVDSEYTGWVGSPPTSNFRESRWPQSFIDGTARQGRVARLLGDVVWALHAIARPPEKHALKIHEQGLEVVAINFDEDRAGVESVVKSKGLPWPQSFEGVTTRSGRKFGITHYPSAWLVDKAGNVRTSARSPTPIKKSAPCWRKPMRRRLRWERTQMPAISGA